MLRLRPSALAPGYAVAERSSRGRRASYYSQPVVALIARETRPRNPAPTDRRVDTTINERCVK